jgi:hypothetical protein
MNLPLLAALPRCLGSINPGIKPIIPSEKARLSRSVNSSQYNVKK